jgi:hypothetical protein
MPPGTVSGLRVALAACARAARAAAAEPTPVGEGPVRIHAWSEGGSLHWE